jgi:peroxiredoxin (alkyl hydroperoxide reductase subunit C)
MQVLAVSCDSRHAQAKWAEEQGFGFPVLSDFWPHGKVAKAYGIFNEDRGCANRATFLIDSGGKVVDTFATEARGTPREAERYVEALAKLRV